MQKITVHEYIKSLPKIEKELDGTAMCAMKWMHQFVNLETGVVKMCHNVPHRYITEEEIEKYGKDIFMKHPYEQERREEKLNNIKHHECASCWQSESKGVRSCRLPKPFYDLHRTRFGGDDSTLMPSQLEVMFSNSCDLKCIYCSKSFSSQWAIEEKKFNPEYVQDPSAPERLTEVFWSWMEDAVEDLLQYYIMGGEPLLQPQFYDFLDRLIVLLQEKPNRFNIKPELIVHTNGNTPEAYLNKWINILPKLTKLMSVQMDISIEGYESRAEFIRSNLNWERFAKNVDKIFSVVKEHDLSIRFSITHSALSITSCTDLLRWIKKTKDKYDINADLIRTSVSRPTHLAPWMLTEDFKNYIDETCNWITDNAPEWQSYIGHLQGISNSFGKHSSDDLKEFLKFKQQMLERRNLEAEKIFPEMTDWFKYCQDV